MRAKHRVTRTWRHYIYELAAWRETTYGRLQRSVHTARAEVARNRQAVTR